MELPGNDQGKPEAGRQNLVWDSAVTAPEVEAGKQKLP